MQSSFSYPAYSENSRLLLKASGASFAFQIKASAKRIMAAAQLSTIRSTCRLSWLVIAHENGRTPTHWGSAFAQMIMVRGYSE
jgi:hypothetical protein